MLTINLEKNNKEDRLLFPLGGLVLHFTAFVFSTNHFAYIYYLVDKSKIRFIYLRFGWMVIAHCYILVLVVCFLLGMENFSFCLSQDY